MSTPPSRSMTLPVAVVRPSAGASGRSARNVAVMAAGVALSALCLYLAMRGADLPAIGAALASANLWFVLPLLAAQVLFYALKAVRWRLLLTPVHAIAARRLVAPMMIGFMGNNLLPARLGEIIRIHLGARLMRVSHTQVLATLVLERLFDVIAVLVLFAVATTVGRTVPAGLVSAAYVSGALSVAAIASTAAYVVWTGTALRAARRVTRVLPAAIAQAVVRQLELGASGMSALRQPQLLAGIVVTSVLQWFLMAACIYLSFQAVGVQAPFAGALIVLAATVFGVMVPAAPGFFGTLHLAFVLALTPFGVGAAEAMAAAVFYHIIPYAAVILAGAWFVRQMGYRLQTLERVALEIRSATTGAQQS